MMPAATMEEWLNMFNAKIKKENRNAILFLDNATCHPKVPPKSNAFKCENCLLPSKYKSVLRLKDGCYSHIQIALQTISEAIFYFECRSSR
jgi:hypothetical protein